MCFIFTPVAQAVCGFIYPRFPDITMLSLVILHKYAGPGYGNLL